MKAKEQLFRALLEYADTSANSSHREAQELRVAVADYGIDPAVLDGINILALHVLQTIGRHRSARTIDLAELLGVTKGAISKITKKLQVKQLVEKQQRSGNLKETFYVLLPLGQQIFDIHEHLHQELRQGEVTILQSFSDEDLLVASEIIEKLNQYRKNNF